MSTIWIKQPLAIFTENTNDARGGMVISQGKIVELVPLGQTPIRPIDETFNAQNLVVISEIIIRYDMFFRDS
jgi:8-oxoguanine deaminase